MGSSKRDKQKDDDLRRQQDLANQQYQQQFALATKPNPLAEYVQNQDLEFLKAADDPHGFDVMKLPGMSPYTNLFSLAKDRADSERQGIGALRLGVGNGMGDANLAANLTEQSRLRREQDAAGNLENTFNRKYASARGEVMPLASLDVNQRMGTLNTAAGRSANLTGQWAQYRPAPSLWSQFLFNARNNAQGSGSSAAAYAARGGNWSEYLGRPVGVGEEGLELAVDDQGNVHPLGARGPETVIPMRPATVVPHDVVRRIAAQAAEGLDVGGVRPRRALMPPSDASRIAYEQPPATEQAHGLRPRPPQPPPLGAAAATGEPPAYAPAPLPEQTRPLLSRSRVVPSPAEDNPAAEMYQKFTPERPIPETEADLSNVTVEQKPTLGNIQYDDTRTALRPRIARPVEFLDKRITDEMLSPTKPNGNAVERGLKHAGIGAARGFVRGGLFGAVAGAVNEGLLNRNPESQANIARWSEARNGLLARRSVEDEHQYNTARTDLTKAQTTYAAARPAIEQAKRDGVLLNQSQKNLLAVYKTRGSYDPTTDADLAKEAARLGVTLAPYRKGEKPPPHFTHRGQVYEYVPDDETGNYYARSVLSTDGSALPVDASKVPNERGLLPAQADASGDRKTGLALRRQALELSNAEYQRRLGEGMSRAASQTFNVKTKGLFERLNGIKRQIESYRTRSARSEIMPDVANQRIAELEAQAAPIADEIEQARSEALTGMSPKPAPLTRPASAPAGTTGGASGEVNYQGKHIKRASLTAAAAALSRQQGRTFTEKEAEDYIVARGGAVR